MMAPDTRSVPRATATAGAGWWPALFPLSIFTVAATMVPMTASGGRLRLPMDWVPSLGVNLTLVVDGLSLLFILIIGLVGTAVFVFADAYMVDHGPRRWFYILVSAFMLSMLGLVLVDNLITLFVFWELTTLTSYLLIGFEHRRADARFNARQALLTTGAGGLALLAGILVLGSMGGGYDLSHLTPQADVLRRHPLYLPALLLVLAGAMTKSAQFPFHFWLPNAMAAPTPISAFLHSATMVKAGIYLLARLHPVLGATPAWMAILVVAGGLTALLGAACSIGQQDLKRLFAYTTVMALGMMTMFLGGQTTPALAAAMTFLVVHALYKSALFMVVGTLDHQTGTRRMDDLGGLMRAMPFTAAAAAAAAPSMAGFPLFFGFIGKEIMYKGALTEEMFPGFATSVALVANGLMTAVAGVFLLKVFTGPIRAPSKRPVEGATGLWGSPLVLGSLGIVFGIFPDWVGRTLIEPAVIAFHPQADDIHLKLYYGFNLPLLLSIATLLLGAIGYWLRNRLVRGLTLVARHRPFTASGVYARILDGISAMAVAHTRLIQNGSLQRYLTVIFVTVVLAMGGPVLFSGGIFVSRFDLEALASLAVVEMALGLLMLAALVVVLLARSSLLAVCALGVVGAGSAMLFLWNGAPDVALTQLLVETLTLIIVASVLLRLPGLCPPRTTRRRGWVNAGIALSAGFWVSWLLVAATDGPIDRSVTAYFEAYSYVKAHGRNIVNVILVDFRSLDTLGEIVVVAVAGLAGLALIRGGRPCDPSS